MPSSPQLGLPTPTGTDTVDVPGDLQAIVDRLEAVLANGHDALWTQGDLKWSARAASHGRWLLCDGRELTQAEIESELGLAGGGAAAFVAMLGVGGSSSYGAAASGKVRLPDPRGRVPVGVGAGTGLTSRALGNNGGEESHTLTGAESGLKSHSHSASQAAHSHAVTDPGHNHALIDPGHTHAASQASHSHTVVSHTHGVGSLATADESDHFHYTESQQRTDVAVTGAGAAIQKLTDIQGALRPPEVANQLGTTGAGSPHSHGITGATAGASPATDGKTPTVSVAGTTTGATVDDAGTGITLGSATPAVSVDVAGAATASNGHNNMQPYLAVGRVFIRV